MNGEQLKQLEARLWKTADDLRANSKLTATEYIDHWVDKIQTSSAVKKAINDYLFESLPYPTYGDGDIVVKTEILFNYFKNRYADFGKVA